MKKKWIAFLLFSFCLTTKPAESWAMEWKGRPQSNNIVDTRFKADNLRDTKNFDFALSRFEKERANIAAIGKKYASGASPFDCERVKRAAPQFKSISDALADEKMTKARKDLASLKFKLQAQSELSSDTVGSLDICSGSFSGLQTQVIRNLSLINEAITATIPPFTKLKTATNRYIDAALESQDMPVRQKEGPHCPKIIDRLLEQLNALTEAKENLEKSLEGNEQRLKNYQNYISRAQSQSSCNAAGSP